MIWLDPYNPLVVLGVGAALGCSLIFLLSSLPVLRRPTLTDRLEPYLQHHVPESTLLNPPSDHAAGILVLVTEPLRRLVRWLAARLGSSDSISARIAKLSRGSVEQFRAMQVVCSAGGVAAGTLLSVGIASVRGFHPAAMLGLMTTGAVAGYLLADWWLTQRVKQRQERILTEFPTVAELLALSMTAGESALGALERVSRRTQGELSLELRRALADARTGSTLIEALDAMARRIGVTGVSQFVDGIAVAVNRGSPLADVLRAQATDVRDAGRRRLLETGGRKEVAMLVPVVLFVLPVTVVFAVYPSILVLNVSP